jgi:phosphate transport system permease protein
MPMTTMTRHPRPQRRSPRRTRAVAQPGHPRSVIWGEKIAGGVITVGGLMVIVAVLGIMVFLFRVVMPLMAGGEMLGNVRYQLDTEQDVIWVNGDEFQTLGIAVVGAEGRVITFHVPTGTEIARQFDFGGAEVTAVSGTLERAIRLLSASTTARCALPTGLFDRDHRAAQPARGAARLDARDRMGDGRVFTEVGTGDFRTLSSVVELGEAEAISEHPIIAVDYRVGGTRERPTLAFATVDARTRCGSAARACRST